jgi:hypothetical protein
MVDMRSGQSRKGLAVYGIQPLEQKCNDVGSYFVSRRRIVVICRYGIALDGRRSGARTSELFDTSRSNDSYFNTVSP